MNIMDAAKDLADALQEDGAVPVAALNEVAEIYGLNPALLRRKFEEWKGCPVEEWLFHENARKARVAGADQAQAADQLARAVEMARQIAAREYEPNAEADKFVGAEFDWRGEPHVFVALRKGARSWPLRAVRVRDLGRRRLTTRAAAQVMAQIKEKV